MKVRIGTLLEALRASYWFVPAITSVAAITLAFATTWLDQLAADGAFELPSMLYGGTAAGARQLLATLASAMMSVTSVVFSITIVALTLASSQFGPRLLRNFMKDVVSQWTLGIFIGTFLYSLIVLSDVRGGDSAFVPGISITCAQALAVLSTGVLIYFIHHISTMIQADQVVRTVHDEVCDAIERLLPETVNRPISVDAELDWSEAKPVHMHAADYLEGIDYDEVVRLASEHNAVVRFRCRPGNFVPSEGVVLEMLRGSDELAKAIERSVIFGPVRTPTQDVEFGLLQLAEIAVRSLSPGVNDPFTAMACVDRLGSVLRGAADRPYPAEQLFDEKGKLRVVRKSTDFEGHLNAAFHQIRQNARGSVAVYIRLLEAFGNIGEVTTEVRRLTALRAHAEMVLREAERKVDGERDMEDVRAAHARLIALLEQREGQS